MSGNLIPVRRQRTSEWLEALARKPWAYNRPLLLDLAERIRRIEAIDDADEQLELESEAA
jgi:hypothetical protein